jgi:NTP pyrophosphatase (non-canonical NTP hydrolase)
MGMSSIKELQVLIHKNNKAKGFYEGNKNIGEMLALVHSEISEALEADRNHRYAYENIKDSLKKEFDDDFQFHFKIFIKDTFEDEIADSVIRLLDLSEYMGIDLEKHIAAKMRFNSLREFKHGKKY